MSKGLDSFPKRTYNFYNEVSMMDSHGQKIKGVIFDLDETIINSLGTYAEAFNKGTKIFGLEPVTEERIAHCLDKGLRLGSILLDLFPSVFEEIEWLNVHLHSQLPHPVFTLIMFFFAS